MVIEHLLIAINGTILAIRSCGAREYIKILDLAVRIEPGLAQNAEGGGEIENKNNFSRSCYSRVSFVWL